MDWISRKKAEQWKREYAERALREGKSQEWLRWWVDRIESQVNPNQR